MSESANHSRGERVVSALGFSLVALLVVAPDYWAYHVLSSHSLAVGVSILIVSYVVLSLALWLLCIATRGLGRYRRAERDDAPRSRSADGDSVAVLGGNVDRDCRRLRHPATARHRGCAGAPPRRRRASA
jgi:hypothetical protein